MITRGDKVKFKVIGRYEDGIVFTKGAKDTIAECVLGEGKYIQAIEEGLEGMRKSQKKEIFATPETGYGVRDEYLVKKYPRKDLPEIDKSMIDKIIHFQNYLGKDFSAKIIEVDDEFVVLDLNHPLADKNLIFKVEVLEVEKNALSSITN